MVRIGCALLLLVLFALSAGAGRAAFDGPPDELSVVDYGVDSLFVGLSQADVAGALITAIHRVPRSLARLVRTPTIGIHTEPTEEPPPSTPNLLRFVRCRQPCPSAGDGLAPH